MSEIISKRLFIGGLAADVTSDEVAERFSRFGQVSNVSLKTRKDGEGNPFKSFAHLDLEGDESNIKKCFNTYQNAKWKGSTLKLQYAKESFLDKLQKERQGDQETVKETPVEQPSLIPPTAAKQQTDLEEVKGSAVPGTPVPGKKDWIVGKYGRVLPVLKLKKSYKIKMVKHDPSKFCHTAKVFKDDSSAVPPSNSSDKLTWEINTPDTAITKKRKGQFPVSTQSSKKRKEEPSPLQKQKPLKTNASEFVKDSWTKKTQEKENETLEIVKLGFETKIHMPTPLNSSNRFDSDIESDPAEGLNSVGGNSKDKRDLKKSAKMDTSHHNGEGISNKEKASKERNSLADNRKKRKGKNKRNMQDDSSDEDNEKIPEFKGLQMLGLISETSPSLNLSKDAERDRELTNDTENSSFISQISEKSASYNESASRGIPEFRGLSMLSNIKAVSSSSNTEGQATTPSLKQSSEFMDSPTHTPDVSNIKPCKKSAAKGQQKASSSVSPKEIMKSKNNDSSMAASDGNESASSADTDEIIARYKEKQNNKSTQNLSSDSPKTFFKTSTPLLHPTQLPASSIRDKKNPLLDQSLYLSEFEAGAPEISDYSLPNTSCMIEGNTNNSDDSELDSNDFELVAKKLAQKAAKITKGVKNHALKKETANSRLSEEPKLEVKKKNEGVKEQTGGRTTVQNKLLGIAGGLVGSTEENKKLSQDSKKKTADNKPDKDNVDTKNKQISDNEKRLQALKEKQKQRQQEQNLMQQALKNVDSRDVNSTKRIVFSSSEDTDNSDSDEESLTRKTSTVVKESREKKEKEGKDKLALFESSSDESDESNYDEIFKSKPHFEGKKGEKLMKLQKKIGDSRFKVDAKFAESDSEDEEREEGEGDREKVSEVDKSLEEEKAASLKVLENVIGKSTLDRFSEKIKRNTKHLIDMNAVRFDPTKIVPQAEAPEQTVEAQKKQSKLKATVDDLSSLSKLSPSKKTATEEKKNKKIIDAEKVKTNQSEDKVEKGATDKWKKKKSKTKEEGAGSAKNKSEKTDEQKSSASKSRVEMSSSLVDLFKTKQDEDMLEEVEEGTFSLMEQFSKTEQDKESSDEEDESDTEEEEVEPGTKKEKPTAPLSGLFKKTEKVQGLPATTAGISDGKSESDSDDESVKDTSSKSGQLLSGGKNETDEETSEDENMESEDEEMVPDAHDITKSDKGIEEDLLNAGRIDVRFNKEQWHQRWEDIRPTIVKLYKRKHKDALKNKRVHNEKKRRREFLKNSKKGMWSRRKR